MKMRDLPLVLALLLSGCVRNPGPRPAPMEEDTSIVFPPFFEHEAVTLGAQALPYELDGVTLRAVTVAAHDFLGPSQEGRPCPDRQEAHRYRVIRQGNILFVRIDEDPAYCGPPSSLSLDSGAKYAISTEGRILRRVMDGEPERRPGTGTSDAGEQGVPGEPGVSPTFDANANGPSPFLPPQWQDGGSSPLPPPTDGGSSGEP